MFRVIIQGKTIKDLRENLAILEKAFYSGDIQPEPAQPEVQEDFLTQAAELPKPFAPPPAQPLPTPSSVQVPTAPAAVSPGGTDSNVDSKGMPWDERIHSASAAKNNDGSWRYRRNVEKNQIQAIEQELIAKLKAGHIEQPAPFVPPPIPAPVAFAPPPLAVVPPPIPAAPKAPPAPPPLPNAFSVEVFVKRFIEVIGRLVKDGKITAEYLNSLKSYFETNEIHELNDDQRAEVFQMFVQHKLIESV